MLRKNSQKLNQIFIVNGFKQYASLLMGYVQHRLMEITPYVCGMIRQDNQKPY
ncbi:unnamed protein product [Paramecium sonneborni]|uniref:Uncharacterized protein n=1 Tax=Paramecium sonneborni TaxID=65129 RepID=A0A8S1MMT5_9CILI|nr:unnamed protein product [Paramecium sonneborni]